MPGPVTVTGPIALTVKSPGTWVWPLVPLSTTLTRVSRGATAVLVIWHETFAPGATVTIPAASTVPPWQTQVPGVKPAGPASDSV